MRKFQSAQQATNYFPIRGELFVPSLNNFQYLPFVVCLIVVIGNLLPHLSHCHYMNKCRFYFLFTTVINNRLL